MNAAETSTAAVHITRVVNPCALIEIGDVVILTDPYFEAHRVFPMREPIGLLAAELPKIDVIIGGHGVRDHWHPQSMSDYRFHQETPVFTATNGMARKAKRAGFPRAERLDWGVSHQIAKDVVVHALAGESVLGGVARTNNYLIEAAGVSVLIGTEACSIEPLRELAGRSIDIAVLPIDGLTFGPKRLVMDAATALASAVLVGADTLAPIHYSQQPVRGLWRCPSGLDDLLRLAPLHPGLSIAHGATGERVRLC